VEGQVMVSKELLHVGISFLTKKDKEREKDKNNHTSVNNF